MSAYFIFTKEKTLDQQAMDLYSQEVRATFAGHPVKVLAAYGAHEVVEGDPTEGVVIAEFPSMEAAKAWYDSRLTSRFVSTATGGRSIVPSWCKASKAGAASSGHPPDHVLQRSKRWSSRPTRSLGHEARFRGSTPHGTACRCPIHSPS